MPEPTFRPLTHADLPRLHAWLHQPHVLRWWNEPLDLAGVTRKYGPRIDGAEPTRMFIVMHAQTPIGWLQCYRWADYPEHARRIGAHAHDAGLDLAIGEPTHLGRGLGARVITRFVNEVLFADPDIRACVCDPDTRNHRSLRAFTKAGFTRTTTVTDPSAPAGPAEYAIVRLTRPR